MVFEMLVVLLVVCIFMTNVGARDCSERFANECECYYSGMKSCCAITMFNVIVNLAKSHGTELTWSDYIEMLAKQDVTGPSLPHLEGYADATLWNTLGTSNENMIGKVAKTMHDKQGYLSDARIGIVSMLPYIEPHCARWQKSTSPCRAAMLAMGQCKVVVTRKRNLIRRLPSKAEFGCYCEFGHGKTWDEMLIRCYFTPAKN